jgi:HEAT repeat protein
MYDYKMTTKLLNRYLINISIISMILIGAAFAKPVSLEKVEDLRLNMIEKKNKRALVQLISIYKDRNQAYDVRLEALRALAESRHPSVIEAMQEAIRDASMIELDLMLESIEVLSRFGVPKSSPAFVNGLKTSESKIMAIREAIIAAIGKSGSEDQIVTLLDLYEISKNNAARMDKILSLTLGAIEDDRAIPILMDIASNETHDIKTRTIAVETLAKKQAPELVDYFIQLLGDPSTRHRLNEFSLSVMGEIDNERMILALLESYKNGKTQYHSLLNTVLSTFEEYQNPEVIPLLQEVALTRDLPHSTRLKAIKTLARYDDERSIDAIVEMLEDSENYIFYYDIIAMMDEFGGYEKFKNRIRKVSYKAMINQRRSGN